METKLKKQKHRFIEQEILKIIEEIHEVFGKNNIRVCLDYGTLLGAIRNKKLLPWDNDVDFRIWKEDIEDPKIRKKITKELMAKGYSVYFLWYGINMDKNKIKINVNLTLTEKNKIIMDRIHKQAAIEELLFKIRQSALIDYYGGFIPHTSNGFRDLIKINLLQLLGYIPRKVKLCIYKFFNFILGPFKREMFYRLSVPTKWFKLKKIKFYDLKVNVPVGAKKYLAAVYGHDWHTPPEDPATWGDFYDHGAWKPEKKLNIKHNRYGW